MTGIENALRRNDNPEKLCPQFTLEDKANEALPSKFFKNVFCTQNKTTEEGICPKDKGKIFEQIKSRDAEFFITVVCFYKLITCPLNRNREKKVFSVMIRSYTEFTHV